MFSRPKNPCPKIKEIKGKDLHENITLKSVRQKESDRARAGLLDKYKGEKYKDKEHNGTSDETDDHIFDYYKLYFDHYVSTRAERTEWNKYFLTLLFIQTLVAFTTALLGALGKIPSAANATTNATVVQGMAELPDFAKLLIAIIAFVAAAISLTWFARLRYMKNLIAAEETVLKDMEQAFSLPFAGVYREDCAFKEEDGMIGVPFFTHNYIEQRIWVALNYWLLPLLLLIVFIGIGFYFLLSLGIIKL